MSDIIPCRVIYDWAGTDSTEMSIKEGDFIVVKKLNDLGWAYAVRDTESGWIPFDFAQRIDVNDKDPKVVAFLDSINFFEYLDDKEKGKDVAASEPTAVVAASEGVSADACFECKKPLTGASLSAKGHSFHAECFTCTTCKVSLAKVGFLEKDGKFYCEKDYYALLGKICAHCNEVIIGSHIVSNEKTYHVDHLLCKKCNVNLGANTLIIKEGHHYCESCYNENYAVKCFDCNLPIEGQVFTALEKSYHRACFKCSFDGHVMEGESFHAHEDKIYCGVHYRKMFGKVCQSCTQDIDGQYLQVLDAYFHPDCWICSNCKTLLQSAGCVKKNNSFYCPPCGSKVTTVAAPATQASNNATPTTGTTAASHSPTAHTPITEIPKKGAQKVTIDALLQKDSGAKPEAHVDKLPVKSVYTLQELQNKDKLPAEVDLGAREKYLSDADFEKLIGMSRAAFADLKLWRQQDLKKKINIL